MKRPLLVGLCVALAGCITDPVRKDSFEGTITAMFIVKDVFQGTTDVTLTVDANPAFTDLSNLCADKASVHVRPTTTIAWSHAPDVTVSQDELTPGQRVRVLPPDGPVFACKRAIEATSIIIVSTA